MSTSVCSKLPEGSLAAQGCLVIAADPVRRPIIVRALNELSSPDDVCQNLKFCTNDCRLFRKWPVTPPTSSLWADVRGNPSEDAQDSGVLAVRAMEGILASVARSSLGLVQALLGASQPEPAEPAKPSLDPFYDTTASLAKTLANPCGLDLKCNIDRVFSQHLPLYDDDNDFFTGDGLLSNGFRGQHWRGRDCDDKDAAAYPGRRPTAGDATKDSNCNGISGVDQASGVPVEAELCDGTNPKGVIILGDSAAAHFSIPPAWLNARKLSLKTFSNLIPAVEDELDWPQCSWATAHVDADECPVSKVPMDSIYQRMVRRNRCMRNDFQNIGVNGARTGSMVDIVKSFKRDQQNDSPALVFFALIGNDVCNGHPGMDSMTTPEQFEKNVLTSLEYLDTVLPANSTVVTVGLANGLVLWKYMHTQIHPIGVPYPDLYDFLICESCTPCLGWMNGNETMRNLTQQRADQLSAVYPKIVREHSYKHFDLLFYQPDWEAFIAEYVAAGGQPQDVIEPVDGFHPSQTGQNLISQVVWDWLESEHPSALTGVNPHNDAIDKLTGVRESWL